MSSLDSSSNSMLFICGLPRGGTTALLTNLPQASPQVLCFGETCYFGRNYNRIHELKGNKFIFSPFKALKLLNNKITSNNALSPISMSSIDEKSRSNPGKFYKSWINELSKTQNKEFIFEKTPHHVKFIPRILSFFPDAKFLVCWRDPYTWLLSYKNQSVRFKDKQKFNHKLQYNPFLAVLNYSKSCTSLLESIKSYPDHIYIIMNSDLKNNTAQEVSKALKFISPSIDIQEFVPSYVNSSFDTNFKSLPREKHLDINKSSTTGFKDLSIFEEWLIFKLVKPNVRLLPLPIKQINFNFEIFVSLLLFLLLLPFQILILLILKFDISSPFSSLKNYLYFLKVHLPFNL